MFIAQQRIAIHGHAARRDIIGRGAKQAGAFGDHSNFQIAIGEGTQMEGEVKAFSCDVDDPVREAQADVDVGVLAFEFGDMGGDEAAANAQRGGHKERASGGLACGHHRCLGGLDCVEDAGGPVIEEAAMFRGIERAGGSVEQAHAEMAFEFGNTRGGHGGGGSLIAGGGAHGAEFVDTQEHSDIIDIGHFRRSFETVPSICVINKQVAARVASFERDKETSNV